MQSDPLIDLVDQQYYGLGGAIASVAVSQSSALRLRSQALFMPVFQQTDKTETGVDEFRDKFRDFESLATIFGNN